MPFETNVQFLTKSFRVHHCYILCALYSLSTYELKNTQLTIAMPNPSWLQNSAPVNIYLCSIFCSIIDFGVSFHRKFGEEHFANGILRRSHNLYIYFTLYGFFCLSLFRKIEQKLLRKFINMATISQNQWFNKVNPINYLRTMVVVSLNTIHQVIKVEY